MKRFVIVLLLGVAILVLMAAPASASLPSNDYEMMPGNAYVFAQPENGGTWWLEVDAGGDQVVHEASTEAIPESYDVWLYIGWTSPTRGVIQSLPLYDRYAFAVKDAGGHTIWSIGKAATKALWTSAFNIGPLWGAFNKANADFWMRLLYVKVGGLAPGGYTALTTETVTRPINDLSFYGEDEWAKHAQQKPVKIAKGTYTYIVAFSVE